MYWQSQWVTTMFLWLTNDRVSEKIFFYGEKKIVVFIYLFLNAEFFQIDKKMANLVNDQLPSWKLYMEKRRNI